MICGSTSSAHGVTQQPLKNFGAPSSCVGVALEVAAEVAARLERDHRAEQADGVEVVNRLGVAVVAHERVVAGERQHVLDAQDRRAQEVALQRQAVPVAADHLEDRLDAALDELGADRQRADAHDGGLDVGHVDGHHLLLHQVRAVHAVGDVGALGRADLAGDREFAGLEGFLELAHAFASFFAALAPFFFFFNFFFGGPGGGSFSSTSSAQSIVPRRSSGMSCRAWLRGSAGR